MVAQRVNKPFRIDKFSVFLSFVHQAALMIWNEWRKRELALLDDIRVILSHDARMIRHTSPLRSLCREPDVLPPCEP
jgi:hypothetical protein